MIRLLHAQLGRWRDGVVAVCCAFVLAQTIGLAHMSDLTLHADGTACQICVAIGHAAAPPAVATVAPAPMVFEAAAAPADIVAAALRPTFSPHAARAPPTFL